MGLGRTFRKITNSIKFYKRDQFLRQLPVIDYEGLAVSTRRTGMITPIQHQIYHGEYERPEITGLSRTIRPGDRVLELGAGLGIISALAARAAGPQGRVLSYEANAALLDDTHAFFAANQIANVDLVNAVLVPEANPAPRRFHLAGSFAESSLLGAGGRDPQGQVEVRAECLSDVLASFCPDVLICDIEGAEAELFSAMPPSTLRAAVVEMHPDRLSATQIQTIHDAMAAQGLHLQTPGPGGTVVIYARTGAA